MLAWLLSATLLLGGPTLVPVDDRLHAGQGALEPADAAQLRELLPVHARTQWTWTRHATRWGSALLVAREHWLGIPIAGAVLGLRVGPDGRVRQTLGRALVAGASLPTSPPVAPDPALRWWPTPTGLVLVRVRVEPTVWTGGEPRRDVVAQDVASGATLARWSALEHGTLEIHGWRENPVSTPEPHAWDVEVVDADPIVLEDALARVVGCEWVDGVCEPVLTTVSAEAFAHAPPGTDDASAHADPHDAWAGAQALQYLARIEAAFLAWGWDAQPWEHNDCSWQDVDVDQCKLHVFVNVLSEGESGPEPFDGAFYDTQRGILMGQGLRGDMAFDMQLLAHEFTHFVIRGMGAPEPTDFVYDWKFLRADAVAIGEGQADLFARFASESDELFRYFRNYAGLYQGARRRDVALPFRCPENITGEVHMEGRIWAAAWHAVDEQLRAQGLATPGEFPALMLASARAIRLLPAENRTQFATATSIVLDEIALSLSAQAQALAREIVSERGLLDCDYVIDIAAEPDPETSPSALHARFVMLHTRTSDEAPDLIEQQPHAPPVQHRIRLGPTEDAVVLTFVPDRWRRTKREDEPLDQAGLVTAALVKQGEGLVDFVHDPLTDGVTHDADRLVLAHVDPDGDGTRQRIVIDELPPGSTQTIALVSLTALDGERHLVDDMRWTVESNFTPPVADAGCGCQAPAPGSPGTFVLSIGLLALRLRPLPRNVVQFSKAKSYARVRRTLARNSCLGRV